jgi:ubiquinone/menaquinone biosynthesis C-methylase UbiE
MNTINDQTYVHSQYRTQDNLQVRIQTHVQYSQPKVDLPRWVVEQIPWNGTERVIDVGCGNGAYTEAARQRGRYYVAADLSFGMLHALPFPNLPRLNLDAQFLPFPDQSADVIMANFMLFHVPDIDRAVAEFARVLRPGGRLLAATNSAHTMLELPALGEVAARRLGMPDFPIIPQTKLTFNLENGATPLAHHFAQVTRHDLPGALIFPSPEPVIAYLTSTSERLIANLPAGLTWDDLTAVLHELLTEHIAQHGHFRVNKLLGVFVAQKEGKN